MLDAQGGLSPDAIQALVEKARSEKPHLFRPGGPGSPSNRGGEIPQIKLSGKHAAVALTQDELDMAKRFGMTPEEYAEFKR